MADKRPTLADAFRVQPSPAPWEAVEWYVHDAFANTIADCMGNGSAAQWKVNAALIAAAPDLLAALRTAEAILYAHGKPIDPAITAAIAKATGDAA